MCLLAALIAVCFGMIGRETGRARALYGLKVFTEFVGISLLLSWILYFIPR